MADKSKSKRPAKSTKVYGSRLAIIVQLVKEAIADHRRLAMAGAFMLIVLLGAGMYSLRFLPKPSADGEAAVRAVESKISRHYVLPTDETPALATVTDTAKLNTPFLKKAKNGDKVLIYQTNSVAIIYRPSIDRIIAVGPVQIDTPKGGTEAK